MAQWNEGYVTDINYTHGYYPELNPLRARLPLLHAGLVCPDFLTACELGFGHGLSINCHAAASPIQWWGTDFNPSHAAGAQELAACSKTDIQLYNDSFAEFTQRRNLPDFDFIGLHGIWSWISNDNHALLVDFIGRKLKAGGLLYISYNTLPGWAAFAPMRELFIAYMERLTSPGEGISQRIDKTFAFVDAFLAAEPGYAAANSQLKERYKRVKEQNRAYLAHEYFNRDWRPMTITSMAEWLEEAKLSYACSAHYLDNMDQLNLPAPQKEMIDGIQDPIMQELVRDFFRNQQFRRDYWIKGRRTLSPMERRRIWLDLRVILTAPRTEIKPVVKTGLREIRMHEEVYQPLLDLLADGQVHRNEELEQTLHPKGLLPGQVMEAIFILAGMGHVALTQKQSVLEHRRPHTERLNEALMQRAKNEEQHYLVSPMTGGALNVSRFEQLFLLDVQQGENNPAEWAQNAWQILAAQGQRLIKEGKTLRNAEENLNELNEMAIKFAQNTLPLLRSLHIL